MPNYLEEIIFDEEGFIIDYLTEKSIKDTPEERVRQKFVKILHTDYGYPKELIRTEIPIQSGSKILLNEIDATPIRADIVVYKTEKAASEKDQGNIMFVVECKQPNVEKGHNQLVSYMFNTSALGGIWTNGESLSVFRRTQDLIGTEEIVNIPRYRESWVSNDTIPAKKDLPRPHNVRFILSTCHNKLYGRGMENEDFDLAMDMVRILLAKIQDEISPGSYPEFWITSAEYNSPEGRNKVANKVQSLFRKYADQYPDVFDEHEKIQVGNDCIAEAVGILQEWSLAANDDAADDWDLMGETYEQFTHINLKRQQGQFFTNRIVVNMMVKMLDPQIEDRSLDPAGGSGGFSTSIFRHLRRKVIESTSPNSTARNKQLGWIKDRVFLVEIAKRLVKIAKCAMLMTGDGQSGMTRGNSLDSYDRLDPWITARCAKGKPNAPNIIATNPPFSGQKIDSQVADKNILRSFVFGHNAKLDNKGVWKFSNKDEDLLLRQAPEILFMERCLDWLRPGGRLAIVMPKGFLDNISYEPYRQWLLNRYKLNAVITLHKNTFQPDTGVRTCILFFYKPTEEEKIEDDYPIFMAQSQRIGQDSKGNTVYILDGNGHSTGIVNQDLDEIAEAYLKFKNGESIKDSEFIFIYNRMGLKDHLNINPQHYSPKLNLALEKVLEFDNKDNWSTTTIGQLESGIKIFMGPRWNSSNIKIENPSDTHCLVKYLTANAALELRRFTVKWIDPKLANAKQKLCMSQLEVEEGDILITRSGTIGKVTYATKDLANNYLVSDDLVRIRVKDPELRAYLLAYFSSKTALSLMLLDEYGSVQQHLQPRHIQEMLIPIPDDWGQVREIIEAGNKFISALESMSEADQMIGTFGFDSIS